MILHEKKRIRLVVTLKASSKSDKSCVKQIKKERNYYNKYFTEPRSVFTVVARINEIGRDNNGSHLFARM